MRRGMLESICQDVAFAPRQSGWQMRSATRNWNAQSITP